MEVTDSPTLNEGTLDNVIARLGRWCRLAPQGLAYVEYESEFSREVVIRKLSPYLNEIGISFDDIRVPQRSDIHDEILELSSLLRAHPGGVISLYGFAEAFPSFASDVNLLDSLQVLNFYRERLAVPHLKQIWWLPPRFGRIFAQALPDLDSWFLLKLHMDEIVVPNWKVSPEDLSPATIANAQQEFQTSEQYIQIFKNALEQNAPPIELLDILSNAAHHLQRAGYSDDAVALVERSLHDMRERGIDVDSFLLPQHAAVASDGQEARVTNNLADIYRSAGRYPEAEPLYKRAIALSEAVFGSEHPYTALPINNLAGLYQSQHRSADAAPLFERSLAIRKKALGDSHLDVAVSLNNLGGLYQSQGKFSQAEEYYRSAFDILSRVLGTKHPYTATNLNNLAALYSVQGRWQEAEELHRQVLAIRRDSLGENHPDTAASLNNLATLFSHQARFDEAAPLFEHALTILQRTLGDEHPSTQQVFENFARMLAESGQRERLDSLMHKRVFHAFD